MADLTSDLVHKVEGAFYAYLSTPGVSGVAYYGKGHISTTITIPAVLCICETAGDEVEKNTGVKTCRTIVEVRSAGTDLTTHRSIVGGVNDLVQMDDIATSLTTNGDNFHCYDVTFVATRELEEEQMFVTRIELDVVCCAATV